MYKLIKYFSIDCAHKLKDSESLTTKKCLNFHGHTYKIKVEIERELLKNGMVIDFGRLKEIIYQLDHQNLNEFLDNPTAESMVKYLYDEIEEEMLKITSDINDFSLKVTVWETKDSSIMFSN